MTDPKAMLELADEAMRCADIDLSMLLPEVANDDMRKSMRGTLKLIDDVRRRIRTAAQSAGERTVSDEDWQRALDCAMSCIAKPFHISRSSLDNAMQHAFGILSLNAAEAGERMAAGAGEREAIEKALCCPKGCWRPLDCWSARASDTQQIDAILALRSPSPLSGELALIQIAMETLQHIANYSPVSRIQPVMIARDALKKIAALTFDSEPVKQTALCSPSPDAMREALELQEKAEHAHMNCDECDPEDAPETCAKCFPLYDDARVARRAALAQPQADARLMTSSEQASMERATAEVDAEVRAALTQPQAGEEGK